MYPTLEERAEQLIDALEEVVKRLSLPVQLPRVGSMFSVLFSDRPVRNYDDSLSIDAEAYANFFNYLLEHGIYMPPSAVDAALCLLRPHTRRH